MPIHNAEIVEIFDHYANMLDIVGANRFRVRAYRNAARVIQALPKSVERMIAEGKDLSELPTIGDDLAAKIKEIIKTGSFPDYARLQKQLPPGLMELESIPGLGPKRVKLLYDTLGITDVPSLIKAAKSGKLADIKGFGKTSQAKILTAAALFHGKEKRFKLSVAEHIAESLESYLRRAPHLKQIVVAGSFRRRKETVGDLDILITCSHPAQMLEYFTAYQDIMDVISKGETRATVLLHSGIQVDVRAVADKSYGAALLYFTGSKSHNIALRTIAAEKGMKINEYGVFKDKTSLVGKTEEEIYTLLGLSYIEPEIRENQGEIEAARENRLPKLVTLNDIRGDLHAHTNATDGANTLKEMTETAKALGYEYLAITDHTQHTTIAKGQDSKRLLRQCEAIDTLNATLKGITLLKSAEVDILEDGSLDLPNATLKQLDLVVGAVHSKFNLPQQKQTERILRAMDNPYFNILAHPTGRLIGERAAYALDIERIMKAALERGCYLEVNGFPDRLDLDDIHCRMAKQMGLKTALSTDAHHTSHLGYMRYAINQARRGWLEKDDIINTRSLVELRQLLKR